MFGHGLRAGQAPRAPPGSAQPATAACPRHRPQAPRPTNCSRPGSGRCSPPTAMPATRESAMAGLAPRLARGAAARAARPARRSCPASPKRARCSRRCSTPTASRACRAGRAKLPAADIEAVAEWVRAGAVWPAPPPTPRRRRRRRTKVITPEQRAFWSFQPLASHAAPRCTTAAGRAPTSIASSSRGSRTKGCAGRAPPTSVTLLRRATLDLTGLPPTPEEVDAFLNDDVARRVREGRRSPARLAALRRDVGPHVARRRALRRGRLPQPRSDGPRLQPLSRTRTCIATG